MCQPICRETKNQIKIKGVKDKKVHEVRQICPHIRSVWQSAGVNIVIDIGAGQGYISEVNIVVMIVISSIWPTNTN